MLEIRYLISKTVKKKIFILIIGMEQKDVINFIFYLSTVLIEY